MKNTLPYLIFLSLISFVIIGGKPHRVSDTKELSIYNEFIGDSGFILKQQGINLLAQVSGNDTIDPHGGDIKTTDTIGKYYKTYTGRYIACVLDIIHPNQNYVPVVIEFTNKGGILESDSFSAGMYLCCWHNNFEGFKKHGDYFSVKVCGTGSGFCSGEIYLFKSMQDITSGTIVQTVWSNLCIEGPMSCRITSKMEIKLDTVIMHYKKEILKPKRKSYKVMKTEFFDIKYIEKNAAWMALDSTKIYEMPM
ncbi:hypothetical protein [Flavobacterium subsaxonicum]|uniref:Uncharacterized protein n=1 Tax=Flavobacterium subsaxonicum WB 4.1-42 = DSM 21790 TaxID=1121898 RepID=A0A0A2MKB2_9FLAO|nr:hypothetical protein [Flavobacterium subsaxonicum]KGO93077.1 hypothetical protein Q766_10725 [Flavobacterium subsaxonicum WB 4.1-42 = DSM 21790]